ncbi:hypothetical protein Gotur_032586 [Gossypium turneri]
MGFEKGASLLEDLTEKAGGCAVMDGGFATQFESHGASINFKVWSALCLIKDPHLIKQVHLEYLEAGADISVTSSYQVHHFLVKIHGKYSDFSLSLAY